MNKKCLALLGFLIFLTGCKKSNLPMIRPDVVTQKSLHDTDDPAIWVNAGNPAESIVFGTDKESNGAVYAYDLQGRILESHTLRNVERPNNVEVEYGLQLADSSLVDILVFTERERQRIRVFAIPGMQPLDGGGFPVFEDETLAEHRLPMGIGLYKSPKTGKIYAIVGRKAGPRRRYLYQYELRPETDGLQLVRVRKFGEFSGQKEIEAIAVDDALGFVYFSDEGVCIRKYLAEPGAGDQELACFGGEYFREDIEGIAIADFGRGEGCLIVSDQQRGQFNIFSRKENNFIKAVNLGTKETDGCEVAIGYFNPTFRAGLFVAMNDDRDFYFYDPARFLEMYTTPADQ